MKGMVGIMEEFEIRAFLEARALLPNPDLFGSKALTISVGNIKPNNARNMHLYAQHPCKVFSFYKLRCKGSIRKYQWVCTNNLFQQLVDESKFFATITLFKVAIAS